ncbi:MAG: hypothetical protein HQ581_06535 [Planctomycetes bacterium]|nr:hypothetical protein [Planctomycetota bacterium]
MIDRERTTWSKAIPLLENGIMGPHRGYLEIRPDGQFIIEDLPDFSFQATGRIVPHQSASGSWDIRPASGNQLSCLWLDFEIVNGQTVEGTFAHVGFRHEWAGDFLHVIVEDPDMPDAFVMRKADYVNKRKGDITDIDNAESHG